MKIREYSAPLTVLAAGMLGFSLICIVSAAALAEPGTTNASAIEIQAEDIVDSAFSNPINTAVALTAVEIAEFITTPTSSLADLITLTPTGLPSATATGRPFITFTPPRPTRTRDGSSDSTPTRTPTRIVTLVPSRTPTRTPTRTRTPQPLPTFTLTQRPEDTDTPVPPTITDTPVPPTITDTPVPPTITDTPVPPTTITDTPVPPSTETPEGALP